MNFFSSWNIALIYIIGAEIIHLLQLKFTPDLIEIDKKSDDEIEKSLHLKDIYPFLLIELGYISALVYLVFAPFTIVWVYAVGLLSIGLIKVLSFKKIKDRTMYITIDSSITIVITLAVLMLANRS